ncbi:MAG: hypothetical protein FJ038_04305 [Chloroflexi bacterium]|nr:hypothetical protein [Chloroflexota bacterium]
MADGIRIQPRPELQFPDNGMIVVIDHRRPFPPPADGQALEVVQPICSICGVQHFAKNYHVQLRDGTAIVSETVWEVFQSLVTPGGEGDNPFEMVNVVADPPTQQIAPGREIQLIEKFAMPISTGGD